MIQLPAPAPIWVPQIWIPKRPPIWEQPRPPRIRAAWGQAQTLNGSQAIGSAASLAASFGSNVTIGNRILLFTGSYFVSSRILNTNTPTSSPSLTWTQLKVIRTNDNSAGGVLTGIWTAVVGATGTLQITVTNPAGAAGDELGWTAGEYSGLDGSAGTGCLDVSATGAGNSGSAASTTCPTGTTAATAGAGELAVAHLSDWGASLTYTAVSGFNKQAGLSRDAAANLGQCVGTRVSVGTETEGGNFTYASTAVNNGALVAVIKLAAGGAVAGTHAAHAYGSN